MPKVNPDVLKWARETAGLTPEEAAKGIKLNPISGKTAAERIVALENGEVEPTRVQISAMAHVYRRPLVLFYMREVPRTGARGKDFRRQQNGNAGIEPVLDALIRDMKHRQSLVRSALEDDEAEPLPFVGTTRPTDPIDKVAAEIVQILGFSLDTYRSQRTQEDAFRYLRGKIEGCGIFVLLMGHLGYVRNRIPIELYRGYAIADPIAPFIVINSNDAKAALSFTALHECTHIWLGSTGISGEPNDSQIERFCNEVAGSILLPDEEIMQLELPSGASEEQLATRISSFADKRRISRAMTAYRLYRKYRIDQATWHDLRHTFHMQWETSQALLKEKQAGKEGGPSSYVLNRVNLGDSVIATTGRYLQQGILSPTDAAAILGIQPTQVQKQLYG